MQGMKQLNENRENKLTNEMIDKISILSKLELTEAERELAKQDMEKMLVYIDQLKEIDTSKIEPLTHVLATENVLREDVVVDSAAKMFSEQGKPIAEFVVPKTF